MAGWTLPRLGREWYTVEISTDPQIDVWEVSFDHGTTWVSLTLDTQTGFQKILVAGPDFEIPPGDVAPYETISESVVPYVRATDQPEVLIRTTPKIELV
jgi:hypothetical protein